MVIEKKIYQLNQVQVVNSTQTLAWSYLTQENPTIPQLFLAKEQTEGRGTHGRRWTSPSNAGLYMSLLCQVQVSSGQPIPNLTEAIGQSTLSCLQKYLSDPLINSVSIKPPNDIYANGKKLAGLLVETKLRSTKTSFWTVTGLGLNVLEVPRQLTEAKVQATSLEAMGLERPNLLDPEKERAFIDSMVKVWLSTYQSLQPSPSLY